MNNEYTKPLDFHGKFIEHFSNLAGYPVEIYDKPDRTDPLNQIIRVVIACNPPVIMESESISATDLFENTEKFVMDFKNNSRQLMPVKI